MLCLNKYIYITKKEKFNKDFYLPLSLSGTKRAIIVRKHTEKQILNIDDGIARNKNKQIDFNRIYLGFLPPKIIALFSLEKANNMGAINEKHKPRIAK